MLISGVLPIARGPPSSGFFHVLVSLGLALGEIPSPLKMTELDVRELMLIGVQLGLPTVFCSDVDIVVAIRVFLYESMHAAACRPSL